MSVDRTKFFFFFFFAFFLFFFFKDTATTEIYTLSLHDALPISTPPELVLKVGAQVMFVKNDIGEARRFFNGKIGKVIKLEEDRITVD